MLERYIEAGFDPASFWSLTLRLYQIHIRGAGARMILHREQAITAAYLTAGLTRVKKMPKLKELLKRPGEVVDVGLALGLMRARLPKITMAEWQSRGPRYGIQRDRQSAG